MEPLQNPDSPFVWPPPPTIDAPVPKPAPPGLWQVAMRYVGHALAFTFGCFVVKIGHAAYDAGSLFDASLWHKIFAPRQFWLAFSQFFTMSLLWTSAKDAIQKMRG